MKHCFTRQDLAIATEKTRYFFEHGNSMLGSSLSVTFLLTARRSTWSYHLQVESNTVSFLGNLFNLLNQSIGDGLCQENAPCRGGFGELSDRRDVRQETDPG